MKMTNYFKFALMAVAAITLSMGTASCSDDDDDNDGGVPTYLFVPEKTVINDEGDIDDYTISYNNDLRITDLKGTYDNEPYSYKMEYDSEGRISKITYKDEAYSEETTQAYTYSGDKVTILINQNGHVSTAVYTLNAAVTGCVYTNGSSVQNITYKYDANGRLIQRSSKIGNETESMDITYNNDAAGISKNINMTPLMAISLYELDKDRFDFLLMWDKGIATIKKSSNDEVHSYSYTANSSGYPASYKLSVKVDGIEHPEYTATVTYKEVKK